MNQVKRRGYARRGRHRERVVDKLLGELEAEIMALLWRLDETVTVRDVLPLVNARRDHAVAYTTVLTVMARLAAKGLLYRKLVHQTHVYRVAQSQDDFLQQTSDRLVKELVDDFGDVAIASFVQALRRTNPDQLEQLRRYIEAEDSHR